MSAEYVHDLTELEDTSDKPEVVINPEEIRIPECDDVQVEVVGGKVDPAEQAAYLSYAKQKHGSALKKLVIHVEGDEAVLEFHCSQEGFQRIRRVTGYLTGTLDRWNSAKRAEERDRLKHNMDSLAHEHTLSQV